MTNREWLESLSDDDLAQALVHIDKIAAAYYYMCTDSVMGMKGWLAAEREEKK